MVQVPITYSQGFYRQHSVTPSIYTCNTISKKQTITEVLYSRNHVFEKQCDFDESQRCSSLLFRATPSSVPIYECILRFLVLSVKESVLTFPTVVRDSRFEIYPCPVCPWSLPTLFNLLASILKQRLERRKKCTWKRSTNLIVSFFLTPRFQLLER